jgi:hypothetical protein
MYLATVAARERKPLHLDVIIVIDGTRDPSSEAISRDALGRRKPSA